VQHHILRYHTNIHHNENLKYHMTGVHKFSKNLGDTSEF